jgi:hypothetical protein|uniref:Uncharacterized protein n=1 Tax=viral metagenome TaxID=1070528 RepID=A0A6C0ASA1_9ZZZZ
MKTRTIVFGVLILIIIVIGYLFYIKVREGMDTPDEMVQAIAITKHSGMPNQVGQMSNISTGNPLIDFAITDKTNSNRNGKYNREYINGISSVIPSGMVA